MAINMAVWQCSKYFINTPADTSPSQSQSAQSARHLFLPICKVNGAEMKFWLSDCSRFINSTGPELTKYYEAALVVTNQLSDCNISAVCYLSLSPVLRKSVTTDTLLDHVVPLTDFCNAVVLIVITVLQSSD